VPQPEVTFVIARPSVIARRSVIAKPRLIARQSAGLILAAWIATSTTFAQSSPGPPVAPEQAASGPGSRAYAHASLTASKFGSGADEVQIFEPAEPTPERAPVVVFCHGWTAIDPVHYGAWITHIVRRGYTVVFPRYQTDFRTPPASFTWHALNGTKQALEQLRTPGHVQPDERGLAFVGHSMGGLVAANLAALAARGVLPAPLALMSVTPGKTWPEASRFAFPLQDLSVLPAHLLLVTVANDDDDFVRDIDARKIYRGAVNVAEENKNYVRMFSDEHGEPALHADHRAPSAPGGLIAPLESQQQQRLGARGGAKIADARIAEDGDGGRGEVVTNALDYYGTWKLFDGLADAVFRGVNREYALGNTPQQRYMGEWSDRTPVRELMIGLP
jgi:pimeloyl-ACP methyl ester carboxylesterase